MRSLLKVVLRIFLRQFGNIGWGRFSRLVVKREILPFIQTHDGATKILANPSDYADMEFLKHGEYEELVLMCLAKELKSRGPNPIFWDVGAAKGLHSLRIKKLLPDCQILAFEPSPKSLVYFLENKRVNNLDIDIYCMALGLGFFAKTFWYSNGLNSGLSGLIKPEGASDSEKTIVISADILVYDLSLPKPDVVKIDCEGTTSNILQGMKKICSESKKPILIFECFTQEVERVSRILAEYKYEIPVSIDENFNFVSRPISPKTSLT
jgi:FkbM family methyltransferase